MRPNESRALVICAAFATACSSQPRNAKPVAVAQVPAAPGTSTSSTASSSPAGSTVDATLTKEGYRAVRREDRILYCQTQSVTGTKFANTVCMTAEQIQELKHETEQSKRLLIRSGPTKCVGTQCSN